MRWIVLPLLMMVAPVQAAQVNSGTQLSYMLVSGNGSRTGSGSRDDFERVDALRNGAPMFYFRENVVAYVIRDPALLRQAEAIMEPQLRLGARQGDLGEAEGKLGAAEGALGEQEGKLAALMADATPAQKEILRHQQAVLSRQQSQLGEKQSELGRKQAELGERQEHEAELARPKLRALVAEAIRRGLAQRVD